MLLITVIDHSLSVLVKAGLEQRLAELREKARRLEELLPRRVSSEEQREVLCLLCKVHELEIENAEMQSSALLKDNVIRQKNVVVQRFEQHRHLCHEIIQQQRQFIDGESFAGIRNATEIRVMQYEGSVQFKLKCVCVCVYIY